MADEEKEIELDLKDLPKASAKRQRMLLGEIITGCEDSIGDLCLVAEIDLAVGDKDSLKQRKDAIAKVVKRRDEAKRRLDALKPTSTAPTVGQS
jgi:hypothetical protein